MESNQNAFDLLEEMRQRLARAYDQIERVTNQAQGIVNQRDEQLGRLREQAIRWQKGEIGALEAIAGVLADLSGYPLPSANDLERQRAYRHEQMTSMMNEAANELATIEALLSAEGVDRVGSVARQLKDYIHLQKTRSGNV